MSPINYFISTTNVINFLRSTNVFKGVVEQIYTFIDTRQDFRRNTPTRNSKLLFHLLTFPNYDHHISTRITFYPRHLFSLCIRHFHQAFSSLHVVLITSSSRLYHNDITQNVHGPPLHSCFREHAHQSIEPLILFLY